MKLNLLRKALFQKILPLVLMTTIILLISQGCKKSAIVDNLIADTSNKTFQNSIQNFSTAETQDFTAIKWGTAKAQPNATHEIQGEVLNNKLYIFGGFDVNKRPGWAPTKRAYVYDPANNSWSSIKSLPHLPTGSSFGGVTHFGLATDGTDMYLAGGYPSNANGTGQVFGTSQVWKYIVASNSYERLPDLPQPLATGQLKYLNGKIHYLGGANLSRKDVGVHYALTLNNLSAGWQPLAPLNNAVNHPGAAVFNGKIYIAGGAHGQNESTVSQKTLQMYDETTDTWTNLADLPFGIDHISSAVMVYGSRIIVLGGQTKHNTPGKQVFCYTPATNTWSQLTPLIAPKSAGVGAILNGSIYYTGGNFSNINRKGDPVFAASEATILPPSADAYVRNGTFGTVNYGIDSSLTVKGSTASGYARYTYIKFSLNDVVNVNTAKLRLYGLNTENSLVVNVSCYPVDDDSWTESGITFNNSPLISTNILGSAAFNNQAKYAEFDISAFVKAQLAGDKIVTIALRDNANKNSNIRLNSKENTFNQPQLVIQ